MTIGLGRSFADALAALVDGLADPKRQRRAALILVCCYAAVWTLYGVIAKSSQDINADMAEMVVWAREPALGYPKHPPLLAYVVKAWFAVFPLADWAFLLLAAVTVAAGIFLAVELCGIWLQGEKRAAAPFLLGMIPFYNFIGLKFDQNSALIPLWALALWALARTLATCGLGWAALAGLAAAAAMLTKYWSAFLLVAMALAVLGDHRRVAYWRSPAPWTTAIVFLVAVLPHAVWLVQHDFPPLHWIGLRRGAESAFDFLRSLTEYSGGTLGYASPAILLVAFLIHPSGAAVRDSWFPFEPKRRVATVLFWTPLLLPVVVALVARTDLLSLWNAPALNLLPVMMLASEQIAVPRRAVLRLATIACVVTFGALAASPLVALFILKRGVENDAAYAHLAATAAEQQWWEATSAPLRLVAGPFALASAAAFYMKDRPSTYADFSPYLSPWADAARIAHDGIAVICPARDRFCLDNMSALMAGKPASRRTEVALTRHWLGLTGNTAHFVIAAIPPRT